MHKNQIRALEFTFTNPVEASNIFMISSYHQQLKMSNFQRKTRLFWKVYIPTQEKDEELLTMLRIKIKL